MVFNLLGSIGAGLGSLFGGNRAANRISDAARAAPEMLQNSFVGQTLLPQAGQAADLRGALLGLGGDEAAADAAFERFMNSTGFQNQLDQGMNAITGSRAARGILNSGRTGGALTELGSNLARQSFGDFLGQLGGTVGQGLQGSGQIAGAQQGAASAIAGAEDRRNQGLGGVFGALGNIFG